MSVLLIEFGGEKRTLQGWADRLGITIMALAYRLAHWSLETALTADKGDGAEHEKRVTHRLKASQRYRPKGKRTKAVPVVLLPTRRIDLPGVPQKPAPRKKGEA